ncbi:E3 SUMO-protein ligase NSE2-like [Sycon ciliatum]|uniref:E3 SUMO-protein ligase NSE2-like n=1 Tax=Sycon ciliatum TaxID=27933 RepID=UPI0031F60406
MSGTNDLEDLISSIEDRRRNVDFACTSTINIATDLAEAAECYEGHIANLEKYTGIYAGLDREVDAVKSALQKIRKAVATQPASEEEIPNLPELFKQYHSEATTKLNKKDIDSHRWNVEFRQKVYGGDGEAHGKGVATGDGAENDEDLVISQVEVSTNCPITQKPFVEPVLNKDCRHTYTKEAILSHLRKKNGRVRCPVLGCVKVVTEAGLVPDHALQGKLRRQKNALPARGK